MIKYVAVDGFEPTKATPGAAAWDLRITEDVVLTPGHAAIVGTGVKFSMPRGVCGDVLIRSGVAFKKNVFLVNGIGLIDSDFRGEVKLCLSALSRAVSFKRGDRIAQIRFLGENTDELVNVSSLDETPRGDGGFGSTGMS